MAESIAYDNVHYKDKPEAWNMRMVLGVSTVLGVNGVAAAFGLFYLVDIMDSRARHTNRGDADRGLRRVYDATRLGLGAVRLGLCAGGSS
ncbi:MAG: hypothetical protein ABI476_07085 [Oxalobacteraceae bacterium]